MKITDKKIAVVAMVVIMGLAALVCVRERNKQELLASTPLTEYNYWYSLENFPKYKYEAAKMVDELVAEGEDASKACELAIESTSDKIYSDTLQFMDENPNMEFEEFEKAYMNHLRKTQR